MLGVIKKGCDGNVSRVARWSGGGVVKRPAEMRTLAIVWYSVLDWRGVKEWKREKVESRKKFLHNAPAKLHQVEPAFQGCTKLHSIYRAGSAGLSPLLSPLSHHCLVVATVLWLLL